MALLFLFFLIVSISLLILFLIFSVRSAIGGAPFVATTHQIVQALVELSNPKTKDVVCDLGSGDGRIVIVFAKRGVEAHGYENNPFLVLWSRFLIRRAKLSDRAFIHWKNFLKEDLSKYSIVTVFGISYIMKGLEQKLRNELKPGAKVISVGFKFPNWKTIKQEDGLYLYVKD